VIDFLAFDKLPYYSFMCLSIWSANELQKYTNPEKKVPLCFWL